MDAVTKPHLLQVLLKSFEVGTCTVASIVGVNGLKHLTYHEVILAILVKEYVTALKGGLGEVIYILLLLQAQVVKTRDLIAQHLDVGKAVHIVVKIAVLCHCNTC